VKLFKERECVSYRWTAI